MLGRGGGGGAQHQLIVLFQQTWGPVMAKGIEDTAFYRWHRLVRSTRSAATPTCSRSTPADVARVGAVHQQRHWPLGMTTLSTHDTKRSEDVRARLAVLAEVAEAWQRCSRAGATAPRQRASTGRPRPRLADAGRRVAIDDERLAAYLARRCARPRRTSWLEPDTGYEALVLAFADGCSRAELTGWITSIGGPGRRRVNSSARSCCS